MTVNSNKNCFTLYLSGMEYGRITFSHDQIYYSKRNIDSCKWENEQLLKQGDMPFQIPIHKLGLILKEAKKIVWEGESITLESGDIYNKYREIKGNVADKSITSQVWIHPHGKSSIDIITVGNSIVGFHCVVRGGSLNLVSRGYEDVNPFKYWNQDKLSRPEYGMKNTGVTMVPMKDGVKLATEVWLPLDISDNAKLPTVLIRSPYGRRNFSVGDLRFVERGYAVVIQDVRGREDSEGEWRPHYYEVEDGNDTLNWIANQPWSNQRIGMIGASYLGYVQWAAAASGNPYLKAIVSLVNVGTPFNDVPRKGGTILSGTLGWAFGMRDKRVNFAEAERDDWDKILKIRPLCDITKEVTGEPIKFWDEWVLHDEYDGFWRKLDWAKEDKNIDVPALYISGWYDDDGAGTIEAWHMNKKNNRKNQKMILGPWLHGLNTTREINNIYFGDDAIRYDLESIYLKWFDKHLKLVANDIDKEEPVEYYMVGENKWKTSSDWPPREVEDTNLYVSSKGRANTSNGDGRLVTYVVDDVSVDKYFFDPENPTPYLIDVSENEMSVPENYREVEERDDVLVYTSKPLKEDIAIAGDIKAIVYAASSAKDTDWVVRLTDVDGEGNSIRLSDGIIRAKFRNSFDKIELLQPGKVEKYTINMSSIANVFRKGHRIRIEITSGFDNYSFPNHNTGNDPATDTEYIVAEQSIYHTNEFPTHIVLPILYGKLD